MNDADGSHVIRTRCLQPGMRLPVRVVADAGRGRPIVERRSGEAVGRCTGRLSDLMGDLHRSNPSRDGDLEDLEASIERNALRKVRSRRQR